MELLNEERIIKFIRYVPVLIVTLLSLIITTIVFSNKYAEQQDNIKNLENDYINKSNATIKNEVNKIYNYILYKKQSSESQLKKELKQKTNEIAKVLEYTYNKYKSTHNKEQIKEKFRDIIKEYRFYENRGYFYIPNLKGENVIHPLFPELEGKNALALKDLRGNYFVKDVMNKLKHQDEVFYEFYWKRPNTKNKELKKISYNKKLNIYDWYIGTGEYLDIFENRIKKEVLDYVNNMKYGENGFFFVIDYKRNILAHKNKSLIGLNQEDIKSEYIKDILDKIFIADKNNQLYFEHISAFNKDKNKTINSVCYIKSLDTWDWIVGTTFDTKKLQEQIIKSKKETAKSNKKELVELIIISFILIFLSIIIFYFFSRELEKRFKNYQKQVHNKNEENRIKDSILAQQSKMAAMGEMIENITHQWKQPLSLITTISSSISFKQENNLLDSDSLTNDMKQISDSTIYLSNTIDDFKNFFKNDNKTKQFNIKDTINRTFSLLKYQLKIKEINVLEEIEDFTLISYENELIQVLINIINNARDEFDNKEVKDKVISIKTFKQNNNICIEITDNAGGINSQSLDNIFNAYYSTKKQKGGTGIGLYMSKEIITKHLEGQINVGNINFEYKGSNYTGAKFIISIKQNLNT